MASRPRPAAGALRYRAEFDGVRAVAIVAVLSYDIGYIGVRPRFAGRLGIDVFFLLSGYLITAVLLEEHDRSGRIDVIAFYVRRAIRLGPSLLLAIVLAGLVVLAVGQPRGADDFATNALLALLPVANWRVQSLGILSHTWTIALIEQFYLTWPLVLVAVLRRDVRGAGDPARARRTLALLLVAGFAVLAAAQARYGPASAADSDIVYVGVETYAHAMALFLGCTIALVPHWWRWAENGGVAIMAVLGAMWFLLYRGTSPQLYRYGAALFIIFAAALLANVVKRPSGNIARGLRGRPLVAVGRVAYPLYVLHVPVFWYVGRRRFIDAGGMALTLLALIFLIAVTVDWYVFVERRVLRLQERFRPLAWLRSRSGPPRTWEYYQPARPPTAPP
jgi:peptidoglycan/LPS O-acetylase OafA/YrhL